MNDLITSIGLMSGTSCDGIDASIIRSDGENEVYLLGNQFLPYDEKTKLKIISLKERINLIIDLEKNKLEINALEKELTLLHANIINLVIEKYKVERSKINLIGFHGHTIFHNFKKNKQSKLEMRYFYLN